MKGTCEILRVLLRRNISEPAFRLAVFLLCAEPKERADVSQMGQEIGVSVSGVRGFLRELESAHLLERGEAQIGDRMRTVFSVVVAEENPGEGWGRVRPSSVGEVRILYRSEPMVLENEAIMGFLARRFERVYQEIAEDHGFKYKVHKNNRKNLKAFGVAASLCLQERTSFREFILFCNRKGQRFIDGKFVPARVFGSNWFAEEFIRLLGDGRREKNRRRALHALVRLGFRGEYQEEDLELIWTCASDHAALPWQLSGEFSEEIEAISRMIGGEG